MGLDSDVKTWKIAIGGRKGKILRTRFDSGTKSKLVSQGLSFLFVAKERLHSQKQQPPVEIVILFI